MFLMIDLSIDGLSMIDYQLSMIYQSMGRSSPTWAWSSEHNRSTIIMNKSFINDLIDERMN